MGFEKVSHLKLQVSKNIKEFVAGGGFLFTMCSGTDSYDIALSAENVDICEHMFDGDKADPQAQSKLNYNNTLAFKNFKLKMNPLEYEFSDIDGTTLHRIPETQDLFTLLSSQQNGISYPPYSVKITLMSLKDLWDKLQILKPL